MAGNPSTCFSQASPSAVLAATVLSVADIGDGTHFKWTFNRVVAGVTNMTALKIDGTSPDADFSFSGSTATAAYSFGPSPGDPWTVAAGTPGITFAAGAIVTPGQSGVIT